MSPELHALGIAAPDWADFLSDGLADDALEAIRSGERTGRPLGDAAFVKRLEALTGRQLARQKPGPKVKPSHATGETRSLV